jgi:hypothetical protein
MTLTKAIEILKHHQRWRLGEIDEMPYKPLEITEALDVLLLSYESNPKTKVEPKPNPKPNRFSFTTPTDEGFIELGKQFVKSWGDMEKNIHEHLNKP